LDEVEWGGDFVTGALISVGLLAVLAAARWSGIIGAAALAALLMAGWNLAAGFAGGLEPDSMCSNRLLDNAQAERSRWPPGTECSVGGRSLFVPAGWWDWAFFLGSSVFIAAVVASALAFVREARKGAAPRPIP